MAKPTSARWPLWVFLLGNFIIGTGILLPAGLINDIAREFEISIPAAGLLMLAGGIVVALGAPTVAAFTSAIDRRKILTFALLVYAAGHAASVFAPTFNLQILIRVLTVVGATIFTPQAAATTSLIVPPENRAGAIAFIFIGWSAASVVGIPLGNILAEWIGWRMVYAVFAGASLLAALTVWHVIPAGLHVAPLSWASWRQAFTSPLILLVLFVTFLSMSGQFTVFTYIAAIIKQAFAGGPREIAIAFAVTGFAGIIGNALASRFVGQLGISRVIAMEIISMVAGFIIFALGFGNFTFGLVGLGVWWIGSFSSNSLQQSRLVAISPQIASATVALNTSVVFAGQSTGTAIGGWFMQAAPTPTIAWCACAFIVAALACSILASNLAKRG